MLQVKSWSNFHVLVLSSVGREVDFHPSHTRTPVDGRYWDCPLSSPFVAGWSRKQDGYMVLSTVMEWRKDQELIAEGGRGEGKGLCLRLASTRLKASVTDNAKRPRQRGLRRILM